MKLNKTLIGIIAAVVIIGGWAASAYNSMVSEQEKATTALANVQSAYQRRADLSRAMLLSKRRPWRVSLLHVQRLLR